MLLGQRGKRVHGRLANATWGRIDHAQQRNIIVWKNQQAGVGQSVLNLRTLIE
jgi:hypothetical protein